MVPPMSSPAKKRMLPLLVCTLILWVHPSTAEEAPNTEFGGVESAGNEAGEMIPPIEQEELPVQDLETIELTDEELQEVHLKRDKFHGDWNYEIHPRI